MKKYNTPRIFYRVGQGTPDGGGMWYNELGGFHGSMNMPKFKDLQCHAVQMPFDKDIVGYLSVAESLESLKNWFSDKDVEMLTPVGFKIEIWEATDYKEHNGHWIINKETSKMLPVDPFDDNHPFDLDS